MDGACGSGKLSDVNTAVCGTPAEEITVASRIKISSSAVCTELLATDFTTLDLCKLLAATDIVQSANPQ